MDYPDGLVEAGILNNQYNLITKMGKKISIEANSGIMHGSTGEVAGMVTVLRDITERKIAEDQLKAALHEKEILVREVHHRVKNNLQVMSSLISFQQDGISDASAKKALQEAQNRILSMAYIHEDLYQSKNLAMVDLPAYVNKLVSNLVNLFGAEHKIKLQIEVKPLETSVDVAIPCGLIINELVSNALKYAYVGRKRGVLTIRLEENQDRELPYQYHLAVIDDGVGMPANWDENSSKTLGLQLVNILVSQMKGSLKMVREKGTAFHIYFSEKEITKF